MPTSAHASARIRSRTVRPLSILALNTLVGTWCGSAFAAPFSVNAIDAGGVPGGSLGNPITWSPANAAYNNPIGGDAPPSLSLIAAVTAMEFDSYLAIDPIGPSEPEFKINPVQAHYAMGPLNRVPPTATGSIFSPDALSGLWFNANPNGSGGFIGSGPLDRLFIAQLTLRNGTSNPTTAGLMVNIKDSGTLNADGELGSLKFGLANATNNLGKWSQSYDLDWTPRVTTSVNSTFNGGTTYAIYVVAVPAPSSALPLAALVTLAPRRRRRSR